MTTRKQFKPVDEQIAYLRKGAAEVIREEDLRAKLESSAKSEYNGLMIHLDRRFGSRFTVFSNYTLSWTKNDSDGAHISSIEKLALFNSLLNCFTLSFVEQNTMTLLKSFDFKRYFTRPIFCAS